MIVNFAFLKKKNHVYLSNSLLQSGEPALPVLHIQYPEWPDHGTPEYTETVREIFKMLYHVPPDLGPIVVHCRFASKSLLSVIQWYKCL